MKISGTTKIIGIFGDPIEHSFSPLMHNAAFQALNLDYCYVPFHVCPEDLSTAVMAIRAMKLVGVNVTIPHKQKILPLIDEISKEAEIMGAVNTIVNRNGCLVGHNTDGAGFVESLKKEGKVNPRGMKVVILGAGGAARGVAVALSLAGVDKITIINRDLQRAKQLAGVIEHAGNTSSIPLAWHTDNLEKEVPLADLIINTTPMGMYPNHEMPAVLPTELVDPRQVVCDLIYNPMETTLLKEAKAKGCKVLSGWGMLLYQGVLGFQLWTGHEPPVDVMKKQLLSKLGI